jgi:hypothetical protein
MTNRYWAHTGRLLVINDGRLCYWSPPERLMGLGAAVE